MNFKFTEEQNKFRQKIRDFLQAEIAAGTFVTRCTGLGEGLNQEFSKKFAKKGWIGITWPREYGGQARTYVEKAILAEECMKVQAPTNYHFLADRQIGPSIIHFGSQWHKEYFLPKFVKADDGMVFCLLFSEPNAGSDLVNVSTTALKDGDDYIINGQKVWTSGAHRADYGWLLARTKVDKAIPRHLSCSQFIMPMNLPGVTVRPIINSAGAHSFNEVFFDNVRLDKKYIVGKEGDGFKQIMAQMDYERSGFDRLLQNYPVFESLKDYVKEMRTKANGSFYEWVRDQVAQLEIELNIGSLLIYHTSWIIDQGKQPTGEAAMSKLFCNQYEQRLTDVATRAFGPLSQLTGASPWAPMNGDLGQCYLWSPSYTLQGGSTEVLKNIVALRKLGMPRQ